MLLQGLLVLLVALSVKGATEITNDRCQPSPLVDPYAPKDPNNFFPNFFCDLNSDEYGRPYNGPFDQLVPPNMVFPKFPIPKASYNFPRNHVNLENTRVLRGGTTTIEQFKEACGDLVKSNECTNRETCSGSGTQYDKCGRRSTCSNGVLVDRCRERKEWHSLSEAERCDYINAVFTASTVYLYKSCYVALVDIHETYFKSNIHGGPDTDFLPWHRWYILSLENLLRKINCKVTVPYWDWSVEAKNFHNSTIWNTNCGFGGNGDRNNNNFVVSTGPFGDRSWTQPNGQPLRRKFNGHFADATEVARIQRYTVNEFREWHRGIEGTLHDHGHCVINGTMCTRASSNDPIFFLHHGFIDKLWHEWQQKGPEYLHLPRYAQNESIMIGGATLKQVYNLANQPGCVKVCVQGNPRSFVFAPPTLHSMFRSQLTSSVQPASYVPTCTQDMASSDFSPLKLAALYHRPLPKLNEEVFKLFHTSPKDILMTKKMHALLDNYDELIKALGESGYSADKPAVYQPRTGSLGLEGYLFRSMLSNATVDGSPVKCQFGVV